MTLSPPPVPYKILMSVHGRPIYTYMTLDSLQRATRSPYRLTVIHHRTEPTENDEILEVFQRRGVVHRVVEQTDEEFDWAAYMQVLTESLEPEDEFIFFLEDDVVIEPAQTCWLDSMAGAMQADPRLALVGAAIDKSDFIDPVALAAELGRDLDPHELQAIKANSPERKQAFDAGETIYTRHTVAGRFCGLRLAAWTEDLPNIDTLFDRALKERGWKTGILAAVRHRHLSLLNYYDYPAYSRLRNEHIKQTRKDNLPSLVRDSGATD